MFKIYFYITENNTQKFCTLGSVVPKIDPRPPVPVVDYGVGYLSSKILNKLSLSFCLYLW